MASQPVWCPFLGGNEDAETTYLYPAQPNSCHNARPVQPIQFDHQKNFCLTANHTACPVYQRMHAAPLPPEIAAPPVPAEKLGIPIRLAPVIAGLAVFLLLVTSGILGRALAQNSQPFAPLALASSGMGAVEESFELLFPFESTPTEEGVAVCVVPAGWQETVAQPTDTLVRLSLLFNIPADVLQAANCIPDGQGLVPGQRLFVPVIPTATPLPTATPRPAYVAVIPVTSEEGGSAPQPEPTNAPDPTDTPPPQGEGDDDRDDRDDRDDGDDGKGKGNGGGHGGGGDDDDDRGRGGGDDDDDDDRGRGGGDDDDDDDRGRGGGDDDDDDDRGRGGGDDDDDDDDRRGD